MEAVPTIQRMHDHGAKGSSVPAPATRPSLFTFLRVGRYTVHRRGRKRPREADLGASRKPADSVRLVVVEDGDYYDAKTVAKGIAAQLPGWQMEGSVHNVARRDGIGSLMLDAAFTIGRLPDHYFQGIGGGPGPIGIHEMADRLIEAGLFEGPCASATCLSKRGTSPHSQRLAGWARPSRCRRFPIRRG